MLLVTKLIDDVTISHYVLITDLSKLLYNQNRIGKRLEYCRRCLQHFYSIEKLNEHMLQCKKVDPQRTEFPEKKNRFVKFINFKNKIPAPFAVYADFEALIKFAINHQKSLLN